MALIVITGFTASIAAALTVGSLEGRIAGPEDLVTARLASVAASTSDAFLAARHIPHTSESTAEAALAALGEPIDRVLLARTSTVQWERMIQNYLGPPR